MPYIETGNNSEDNSVTNSFGFYIETLYKSEKSENYNNGGGVGSAAGGGMGN